MATIQNEHGSIVIDNDVIANLVGCIINEAACYGIVGMAAKKATDGIYELLNITNYTRGIKVTSPEDNMVNLELHIVVEYGTPISVVANQAMETIRYHVAEQTGLTVGEVNTVVEGVRVSN